MSEFSVYDFGSHIKIVFMCSLYMSIIISREITNDGLSFVMGKWRFDLCVSGTNPIFRLNIESSGYKGLSMKKVKYF